MGVNFKPTMSSISDMKPFRFWCQKVLPTVYDDSLSYYELLNKVVIYLNQTVDNVDLLNDNVTRLYNAYVLLEGYVNTYFDQEFPLLVEEKLDEMAEDGTLTALIKAYIDPYFENKSDEIDAKFTEQDAVIADAIAEQNENIANNTDVVNEVDARLDNFVNAHSGLNGETILFDSENDGPVFKDPDNLTYIELSDSIADYKYIKFIWRHRQDICVQEFEVIENASPAQNFNLRDTLSTASNWEMCQITLVDATQATGDDKLQITASTVFDNLSYANGNVDATMNTGVLKVIGIKDVADTEVLDIRVGANGVTYPNAGTAVRTQVENLQNQIKGGFNNFILENLNLTPLADGNRVSVTVAGDEVKYWFYEGDIASAILDTIRAGGLPLLYATGTADGITDYTEVKYSTGVVTAGTDDGQGGYYLTNNVRAIVMDNQQIIVAPDTANIAQGA